MKRHLLHAFVTTGMTCLLAACLLLEGCSSLKVVETWKSPAQQGHRYQKIMILGVGHDENLRKLAENVIVDELEQNGVKAVASHLMVKEIDSAKRDDIVTAVRRVNADAVLSIRALSRGDSRVTQDGQSGGIYGTATNAGGSALAGARDYALATLQTNLYDSATAELVWSATIKTFDAYDVAEVSRELAKFYLQELRLKGFI
jgi:hypothetical protein